jgi:hypothetical protein
VLFLRKGAPFRSQFFYPFADYKSTVTAKHFSARVVSHHRTFATTWTTVTKHRDIFYQFLHQNSFRCINSLIFIFFLIYKLIVSGHIVGFTLLSQIVGLLAFLNERQPLIRAFYLDTARLCRGLLHTPSKQEGL